MNDYIISVLLGIVEGLTEFLPVSSTAHLRITEALLHINLTDPYWKMYTVVIQFGAIFALLLVFTARIIQFFRTFPHGERGDRTIWTHPISLTLIAFVVTAIPSWLLTKTIGKNLESLRVMAWSLLIGGVVMWVVDAWSSRSDPATTEVEQMSLGQAIWIGLCQILLGSLSGHFPIHVDYYRRADCWNEPSRGTRIQLPGVDPDHDCRNRLCDAQDRPSFAQASSERHGKPYASGDDHPPLDRAYYRTRRFFHRGTWESWNGSCSGCASTDSRYLPFTGFFSASPCWYSGPGSSPASSVRW